MSGGNAISRLKEWATSGLLRLHAVFVRPLESGGADRAAAGLDLKAGDRVLIVAPHYDDEVVGCYHFMARYREACSIEVAFVSEDPDNREYTMARRRESAAAIEPTGVTEVQHWQFRDGDVGAAETRLAEKLRDCNERYDYILTPAPNDRTPDHVVIARIAAQACSPEALIWYRSTWWTFSLGEADFCVTGSARAKRRALGRFVTQGALALANAVSFSRWEAARFGLPATSQEAFQFAASGRLQAQPLNVLSMKSLLRLRAWR